MSEYLDTAIQAAREAEKVILKYFDSGVAVERKEDNTEVTIADKEAEKIIRNVVTQKFPDHGFLGEETGERDVDSEYTWVVDPIDGTRNYSRGIPLFGTLIALMKDDDLILGVINMPVLEELSYAEKGKGAYCNEKLIHVSKAAKLKDAYVSFGGVKKFVNMNITDELVSLAGTVFADRGLGDCWSYALMARGKLDALIDPTIKIWDVAAPAILIEEAGGKLTDLNGNLIDRNVTSVIATNSLLHEEVLEYFKS